MSLTEISLLLVDDDPSAIQIMARMLAEYPDQRFATSGEEALRIARAATPDLILLDADMPGMSGFAVCEALKADPLLARVPIIFATSHDTPGLELAALERGAVDFVAKPLIATQLIARVRAHLRANKLVQGLKRKGVIPMSTPQEARGPAQRILIVDDDTASIHVLRHTLASMGDLHFAQTGDEALRLARQLVPDLILLDAHMPGIDGFDVCRSLKSETPFRHVPIAFVTRFSDPHYEMRALDLGAADFVAKPYTAAVLQARVRNLLDLKRRTDAELQAAREQGRSLGDARVADIVDAASDAIVTYDAAHRVVLMNTAACRMFGVQHDLVIGTSAQTLLGANLPADGGQRSQPSLATIERAGDAPIAVEMSVSRVGEGKERLTTVMLRDNSARDRLEAESRSRLAAEASSRMKTMMMSYIAHEMGNPLNGLLGFAQLMAADASHPLAAAQAGRLEHIMSSGQRLQSLMRDVLDLGCLESGKLRVHLHPINAARCAQEAVDAVSALADHAGVTLSGPPASLSSFVCADAERLHQCLVNLLSNAIKYNRRGGWVRVEINADVQRVTIAIRDNGIGMDVPQREQLFEPFNRLGRQGAGIVGAGLGLVITRQLVLAMAGELQVESEPAVGSCFSISLARASDTPHHPAEQASGAERLASSAAAGVSVDPA